MRLRFSAAAFAFATLLAVMPAANAASRYAGTYTTQCCRPSSSAGGAITGDR